MVNKDSFNKNDLQLHIKNLINMSEQSMSYKISGKLQQICQYNSIESPFGCRFLFSSIIL